MCTNNRKQQQQKKAQLSSYFNHIAFVKSSAHENPSWDQMLTTLIPSHQPPPIRKRTGSSTSQALLSQRELGVQPGPPPCYRASTTEPTQPQRTVSHSVYRASTTGSVAAARMLMKHVQRGRGIPPILRLGIFVPRTGELLHTALLEHTFKSSNFIR